MDAELIQHAKPFMYLMGAPLWEIVGTVMIAGVIGLEVLLILLHFVSKKPARRVEIGDQHIELWVKERSIPGSADSIIIPVATDLQMATGIAKWVKDATANTLQYEAQKHAPQQPGSVVIGPGGRYRFGTTALVVVMDDNKRTSPEWIADSIAEAMKQLRVLDATSLILPDFTDDLLRQPKWISEEQRRDTCRPIAKAMVEGIVKSGADFDLIKIWAWHGNADIWAEELDALSKRVSFGMIAPATA